MTGNTPRLNSANRDSVNKDLNTDISYRRQLRIFLEEICAELCRFKHISDDGYSPGEIRIGREVNLGHSKFFADILVNCPDRNPYFMEIKFGYPEDLLVMHLTEKYGLDNFQYFQADKLVVLVRKSDYDVWTDTEAKIRKSVHSELEIEFWDEEHLLQSVRDYFDVDIETIARDDLLTVRRAIDEAKWRYAFGDKYLESHLKDTLLWHIGFWNLKRLNTDVGLKPEEVLGSGLYKGIVIVMADLCSFSSYVRDTWDDDLVRHCLTAFYSRARYAIHNHGGMLYQFVGDEVVGLFGIPDNAPKSYDNALSCAQELVDVGNSVSSEWQRGIDRVQQSGGVHIGISTGDLNLMPLLPFSSNYVGFVGDAMNMAARLMSEAKPSEILVSNRFYRRLDRNALSHFQDAGSIKGKNLGEIQCWRLSPNEISQ